MACKIANSVIDYCINAINNGRTLTSLQKEVGVSADCLSRRIRERGVEIPRPKRTPDRTIVDHELIKSMYESGKSELAISREFCCSRQVIKRSLAMQHVERRTASEANTLRYAETTEEYRRNLTKVAHDTVRGTTYTTAEKIARAMSREQTGNYSHFGPGEADIASLLDNLGIVYTRQKAIDIYNVDFAFASVAVELTCGTTKYRGHSAREAQRIKKLLECGYKVVAIEASDTTCLCACLDNLIPYLEQARCLPAISSQYWMIRCYSKDYAIVRNNRGQFSRIETPVNFFCERKMINLNASRKAVY